MNNYVKKAQYNEVIQILHNRGMRKQGWWCSKKEPTDFEKGTTVDVNGFKVTSYINPTSYDAKYILPGLDNIKRITQELNKYATYAPKNPFEIHPARPDRCEDHWLLSGKIRLFGEGAFGNIGPLKQGSIKQADMATSGTLYSSPDEFKSSGNPFNIGDSIKLPTGDILHTDISIEPNDPRLISVLKTSTHLNKIAPFFDRSGFTTILTDALPEDTGGRNTEDTVQLSYKSSQPAATQGHEYTHRQTPAKLPDYLNISVGPEGNGYNSFGNYLSYSGDKNTRLFSVEEPSTSINYAHAIQGLPQGTNFFDLVDDTGTWTQTFKNVYDQLSYPGYMDSLPYNYYMPTYGPLGVEHNITPEEWVSYTIPGTYDPVQNQFEEGKKSMPLGYRLDHYSSRLPGWDMVDTQSVMQNYQLPSNVDEYNAVVNRMKNSTKFKEWRAANYLENDPGIQELKNQREGAEDRLKAKTTGLRKWLGYDTTDEEKEITDINNRIYERVQELLKDTSTPFFGGPDIEKEFDSFIGSLNPDALVSLYGLKPLTNENRIKQLANYYAFHQYPDTDEKSIRKRLNEAGITENQEDILSRILKIQDDYKSEQTYKTLQKVNWILRHGRRGLTSVNGNMEPYAPIVSMSEQKDPSKMEQWNRLYQQVMQKCNQYKNNPRYLNVMRNWELSPQGDSLVGNNKPTLTIYQMQQILKEFEEEDKNYQLENSQQFQGIQYGEMPYASMA